MNILIITPFYKQDRTIGSVRWTNIANRLSAKHNVTVVTQPLDNCSNQISIEKEDGILVARANQMTYYEKIAVRYFNAASGDDWQTKSSPINNIPQHDSLMRKIKNRLCYWSMQRKAKSYAKWICDKIIPLTSNIDVVITSACPLIEMLFGHELKQRLGCKWISDFRDLPFMNDCKDDGYIAKCIMQDLLHNADGIIVVTNKEKERLVNSIEIGKDKIHVITNGFSKSDLGEISFIDDDKLHLVYTGSLYAGRGHENYLYLALKQAKKMHPSSKFVVECAGGNNTSLLHAAKSEGIEDIVLDHGFIPRAEALKLQQHNADCLLLFIGQSQFTALTGKVFEYMLCQKPIICISSCNQKNCEAAEFIRNLRLGIAAEKANESEDIEKLAQFLIQQYEQKISRKPLLFNPDLGKVAEYDHDNLVLRVEKLCEQIMKR